MFGQRMYVLWKVVKQPKNSVKVQIKFNIVYFLCFSVKFVFICLICKLYLQVNMFTVVREQQGML